ncbi:MAG: hypothetical protein ACLGH3_03320 [Actinomycetota bacterium]
MKDDALCLVEMARYDRVAASPEPGARGGFRTPTHFDLAAETVLLVLADEIDLED